MSTKEVEQRTNYIAHSDGNFGHYQLRKPTEVSNIEDGIAGTCHANDSSGVHPELDLSLADALNTPIITNPPVNGHAHEEVSIEQISKDKRRRPHLQKYWKGAPMDMWELREQKRRISLEAVNERGMIESLGGNPVDEYMRLRKKGLSDRKICELKGIIRTRFMRWKHRMMRDGLLPESSKVDRASNNRKENTVRYKGAIIEVGSAVFSKLGDTKIKGHVIGVDCSKEKGKTLTVQFPTYTVTFPAQQIGEKYFPIPSGNENDYTEDRHEAFVAEFQDSPQNISWATQRRKSFKARLKK